MSVLPRLAEYAFAHWLPYWWIGDGAMVMHDGAMVLGYRLAGAHVHTQPDEVLNGLAQHLRQLLNALPVGYQLQILRRSGPPPEQLFVECAQSIQSANPILREQRRHSVEHLKRLGLRAFESYLFLSKPQALGPLGEFSQSPWSRLFDRLHGRKNPLSILRAQHVQALEELKQQATGVARYFGASGIRLTALGDDELAGLAFGFLNPHLSAAKAPALTDALPPPVLPEGQRLLYRALSLREQLVHAGLSWNLDTLFLGEPVRPFRVLGLKALPPTTEAALIRYASRIPFEHWLSVGVSVPDSEAKYAEVERRRNRAKAMAVGFVRDVRAATQAEELEAVMDAMVSRDQRVFNFSLHVLFGADELRELDRRTSLASEVFRQFSTPVTTVQMAQLQAYLGMLPGNAHRACHQRTALTDNAADLLPVYDAWEGDKRPVFVVSTRTSEPLKLDITEPSRINWNMTVFGGSGGGKTFLTLSLATSSMLGQGSPLVVIDVGGKELGSYYRLCKLLGGDFVDLSLDGSTAINPFYGREDLFADDEGAPAEVPNEGKMTFLVAICEMAVTDPGAGPISRVGKRILREAIEATYQKVGRARPPLFDDVADSLERHQGDAQDCALAKAFAKTMRAFVAGPAGKLLNQQSKVSIRSSFVVFDLKGLENLGDTASAMLLVVSAYVWNMISKRRPGLAWVVYDETWKLMKNEAAATLQEELYRTARKLRTGVVAITQKLEDFLASAAAKAVLSNTTTTLLLRHKDEHELVAKQLGLNARELELFKSLESVKGHYAEFFLKSDSGSAVGRYAPSPMEYWINTTDPSDRELEAMVLAGLRGNRLAALRRLAEEFPHGAHAAAAAAGKGAGHAA